VGRKDEKKTELSPQLQNIYIVVFRITTLSSSVGVYYHLRGTYCLRFQSALKIGIGNSSETWITTYQTTLCYNLKNNKFK
jgi:hypothetical protein